jgi:hypothetical protein
MDSIQAAAEYGNKIHRSALKTAKGGVVNRTIIAQIVPSVSRPLPLKDVATQRAGQKQ